MLFHWNYEKLAGHMEDNQILQRESLKESIDTMFSFASQVSYEQDHLLPVIQASKSLIGMKLDSPPRNLLKWLENYIQKFQLDHQFPEYINDEGKPEVLSMHHLEKLIVSNKIEESQKYLTFLIQTANPSYIMELLLGISLHHSSSSTLFCWSAFKSIQFMDLKDSMRILFLSLDCLYNSQDGNNEEKDAVDKFYLYCHSHHIKEKKMIRSGKIIPSLIDKIKIIKDENDLDIIIPEVLLEFIFKEGEVGLVNYLSMLEIDEISPDRILLLDALRTAHKYAPESDDICGFKKGKMVKIIC